MHLDIMPMGASLVYGLESDDGNGFRLGLENLLENNGSSVTFLGTQESGSMSQNHHEAYLAITIDKFASKISNSGAFTLSPTPDIILLMLGVNDCWYMSSETHPEDSDPTLDKRTTDGKYTALRFSNLLATLHAAFPDTLVLASELTRNTNEWQDKCIRGFNAYFPTVIGNATSQGQRIRYVSMYDAVPVDMMREDGTHPNDDGYRLIAQRWFEGLEEAVAEICGGKEATKTGVATTSSEETAAASTASATGAAARPTLTLDSAVRGSKGERMVGMGVVMMGAWVVVG